MTPLPRIRSNPLSQISPTEHPPSFSKPNPPGVYIFSEKVLRTFVFAFKLPLLYEGTLRLTTQLGHLVTALGSVPSYESERMRSMTKRRQLVLDFIRAYVRLHGVPPSYEVIAKGIGLKSKSNIHRIVHRLKTDGHIVTKPYKFHAIKLVDSSVRTVVSL